MDADQQRGWALGLDVGQIEKALGLAIAAGVAQRLRRDDGGLRQGRHATGDDLHRTGLAVDGQHGRRPGRRSGDAVAVILVQGQAAETTEILGQTPDLAIRLPLAEEAEAGLLPGRQPALRRRQPAGAA